MIGLEVLVDDGKGDVCKIADLQRPLRSTDEISLADADPYHMNHPQGPRWIAHMTASGGMEEAAALARHFANAAGIHNAAEGMREALANILGSDCAPHPADCERKPCHWCAGRIAIADYDEAKRGAR